ncbi:hypothetical protein ABTM68_21045, partial [Acinetobacter baumannii]
RGMSAAARAETQPAAPGGCRFRGRCAYAVDICARAEPALRAVGADGTLAACHRAEEVGADPITI